MNNPRYWLMKSEPRCFSIEDLAKRPQQTESWDGVRNYQARNFLRTMQEGDLAFFLSFQLSYSWHSGFCQNSKKCLSG